MSPVDSVLFRVALCLALVVVFEHVVGQSVAAAQVLPLDFPEPVVPPNSLCESRCYSRQTMPRGGRVPSNFRILFDANRYDMNRLAIVHRLDGVQTPLTPNLAANSYTVETGVWDIVINDPGHPGSEGDYFVGAPTIAGEFGVGSSFEIRDQADVTPPIADGLRLDLDEIFTNDCGAKAILIRTNLAFDPMAQGPGAKALLVKLESATATHLLWSSISRAGAGFLNGWLHDGPYFQDCIGPTGIETLELCGEVRVTFTLFDHAGNAAEPITQVVQWPTELGPQDAACPEVPSGGCAVVRPRSGASGVAMLVLLLALFSCRPTCQVRR